MPICILSQKKEYEEEYRQYVIVKFVDNCNIYELDSLIKVLEGNEIIHNTTLGEFSDLEFFSMGFMMSNLNQNRNDFLKKICCNTNIRNESIKVLLAFFNNQTYTDKLSSIESNYLANEIQLAKSVYSFNRALKLNEFISFCNRLISSKYGYRSNYKFQFHSFILEIAIINVWSHYYPKKFYKKSYNFFSTKKLLIPTMIFYINKASKKIRENYNFKYFNKINFGLIEGATFVETFKFNYELNDKEGSGSN